MKVTKNKCLKLEDEFEFFNELILNIKMRKILFEKFDKYLVDKKVDANFPYNNDFCQMIWRGYLVQQLLDLEKFYHFSLKKWLLSVYLI